MRYALFICAPADGEEPVPEDIASGPRIASYLQEVPERGIVRCGARLRPATDATTVRVRGDEVLLTDGPFVEAREYVAGIDLVEVADLDEAIALASRHPVALAGGAVEVRPVWE
ncbi:YciI family protein [Streptomyces sp. NPDC127038]|uniref:YciI family protein n=1 Tax=Streptomyces sp. NPDC127038 TaxID=3347114 RepID=UPI00365F4442